MKKKGNKDELVIQIKVICMGVFGFGNISAKLLILTEWHVEDKMFGHENAILCPRKF